MAKDDYWVDAGTGLVSFRDALEDHAGWDHAQIAEFLESIGNPTPQEWYVTIDQSKASDCVNAPSHYYINFFDTDGKFHAMYLYEGEIKNHIVG